MLFLKHKISLKDIYNMGFIWIALNRLRGSIHIGVIVALTGTDNVSISVSFLYTNPLE